jgi:hypothetical protein
MGRDENLVAELVNGLLCSLMGTSGDSPRMTRVTALAVIDVTSMQLLPAEPEQRDGAAILLFILFRKH